MLFLSLFYFIFHYNFLFSSLFYIFIFSIASFGPVVLNVGMVGEDRETSFSFGITIESSKIVC